MRLFAVSAFITLLLSPPSGALHRAPAPGDRFADETAVRGALEGIFGRDGAISVVPRPIVIDSTGRAAISKVSKSPFADDTLRIYVCRKGDSLAGYGIVDNVRGKSRDITYMLILNAAGEVASVEILIYRESHGGEVAGSAFRDQFSGKKSGDRLVAGRDIKTISGATISSRSVTAGVAKLLAAFDRVRGRI